MKRYSDLINQMYLVARYRVVSDNEVVEKMETALRSYRCCDIRTRFGYLILPVTYLVDIMNVLDITS